MKSTLFSPTTWRKKKTFAEQQGDRIPSTPTRPSIVRQRPGFSLIAEIGSAVKRSTSISKETPHRPPRPPSLNLTAPPISPTRSDAESAVSQMDPGPSSPTRRRPKFDGSLLRSKRSMPELDGVWKGFLEDVDEVNLLHRRPLPKVPPLHQASMSTHSEPSDDYHSFVAPRRTSKPRPPPLSLRGSKSTSNVAKFEWPSSPRSSTSSGDSIPYSTEFDSLALFPPPPPLIIRKNIPPSLNLRSSPSLSALPPSPIVSSLDSTPVATPTTPTPTHFVRKTSNPPPSILKNSSSSPLSLYNDPPVSPVTLSSEFAFSRSMYPPNGALASRPGRINHSMSDPTPSNVPMGSTHRSSSSETMDLSSLSRSRKVALKSNKPLPAPELEGRRRPSNSSHSQEVEWGIAV